MRDSSPAVSHSVTGPTPLRASQMPCQSVGTSRPNGLTAPMPVTTTRRSIGMASSVANQCGHIIAEGGGRGKKELKVLSFEACLKALGLFLTPAAGKVLPLLFVDFCARR